MFTLLHAHVHDSLHRVCTWDMPGIGGPLFNKPLLPPRGIPEPLEGGTERAGLGVVSGVRSIPPINGIWASPA